MITEFHIARDLAFAGRLKPTKVTEAESESDPDKPVKKDAPDLVIRVRDQLVVCEGKFFGPCELQPLNRQLKSQRRQVKLLFEDRRDLSAYRHVVILPFKVGTATEADAAFTWGEIAVLAKKVLGESHYVTRRLVGAVEWFEKLDEQKRHSSPGEKSLGGWMGLDFAMQKCKDQKDTIQIGYTGGLKKLKKLGPVDLRGHRWAWRDTRFHKGNVQDQNWMTATEFLEFIEPLLPEIQANGSVTGPSDATTGARWASNTIRLDEVLHLAGDPACKIEVGYMGGRKALESASLVDLKKRNWKWRDPGIHKNDGVKGDNWFRVHEIAELVKKLREDRDS